MYLPSNMIWLPTPPSMVRIIKLGSSSTTKLWACPLLACPYITRILYLPIIPLGNWDDKAKQTIKYDLVLNVAARHSLTLIPSHNICTNRILIWSMIDLPHRVLKSSDGMLWSGRATIQLREKGKLWVSGLSSLWWRKSICELGRCPLYWSSQFHYSL